jgi:hypothetical protein
MATNSDELNKILDRTQIEDLPKRYAHALDARDWEAVDRCFSPDAQVEGISFKGAYPDYIPRLRKVVEGYRTTMHFLGNQLTEVDGDSGRVDTYGVVFHPGALYPDNNIRGVRYHDEVARIAGVWVIAKRTVEEIWLLPVTGEMLEGGSSPRAQGEATPKPA